MSLLRIADTFFALRFLRLLTTPWKKTGAYKAGLVDKNGKVLRKPETSEEKSVYNVFHKLVFNVKRLINKIPLGKSTLASYAAALYLVKENTGMSESLLGELLEELTGYNPDRRAVDLTESWLLAENGSLPEGRYILESSEAVLENGDVFPGSKITIEAYGSDSTPVGSIFGLPVFRVNNSLTGSKILITNQNLTPL
jgi:hypothetical protein